MPTFDFAALVTVSVGITIEADTMQEALAKAQKAQMPVIHMGGDSSDCWQISELDGDAYDVRYDGDDGEHCDDAPIMPGNADLRVGDVVCWASTSNGVTTEKSGRIELVVPANKHPSMITSQAVLKATYTLKTDLSGMARDHVSYLVSVPGASSKAKRHLYWPRVSQLSIKQ